MLAFKHRLSPTRLPLLKSAVTCVNTPPNFRDVVVYCDVIHILQSEIHYIAINLSKWSGKRQCLIYLRRCCHEDIGRSRG